MTNKILDELGYIRSYLVSMDDRLRRVEGHCVSANTTWRIIVYFGSFISGATAIGIGIWKLM